MGCPRPPPIFGRMGREKLQVEIKAEELLAEITVVLRKIPYRINASKHLENPAIPCTSILARALRRSGHA